MGGGKDYEERPQKQVRVSYDNDSLEPEKY